MVFARNLRNAKFYQTSVLVWLLFITYEILVTYFVSGKLAPTADYVNAYIINISVFYVHAHILLPYVYRKPVYYAVGFIVLEFIAYSLIKMAGTYFVLHAGLTPSDPFKTLKPMLSGIVWRFIYFTFISSGYWFALHSVVQARAIADLEKNQLRDQLQNQELEKKLIDSEIAYLKSQINPHFLFNTLNYLYNSALKTAGHLSQPILLLSDIMRYALTETNPSGMVDLGEEIEQIKTLIALNQLRFDNNLKLSFSVEGNPIGFNILPLILLTPVENIFKYADLKNIEDPVKIDLKIKGNRLYFQISNRKLKLRRSINSHGVGLKNLKLRLDAYYPNAHDVLISNTDERYIFELEITL